MSSIVDSELGRLLDLARAGDDAALGKLLERYRRYLAVLARIQLGRHLQSKVDASDVVQEACLGACRDFEKFRGTTKAEFGGWLRQILVNALANVVRRYHGSKRRDVRLERQLQADVEQSSAAIENVIQAQQSSPSQQAARKEIGLLMAEAIDALPFDESELILLRHFDGLSFPEIADRMGRSLDSVKKLWPRALANLRHYVKEKWDDGEAINVEK